MTADLATYAKGPTTLDQALTRNSVLILDGATGTSLQRLSLDADDFGGPQLEGCNEVLNLRRPDVVAELHRSFFAVGVDVVETNTFGAFSVPLGEYGLSEKAFELSAAGAQIAREVADTFTGEDGRPRWVAGSIGPGTKFPTLGQIGYSDLMLSYEIQARGLLEGGADLLIVETQFDLLGAKAAINGSRRAMRQAVREVPIICQVTIEMTGRMLPGTEIGAALATLDSLGVDAVGLNCATGPEEMYEAVHYLSEHSRVPISIVPNAGLPKVIDDQMAYDLGPRSLANHLSTFVTDFGVQIVGGCCGTTPEHLAEVVDRVRALDPPARTPSHRAAATSTYSPVSFQQDTSFLIIGERTNANGSRAFRDALLSDDIDRCVAIGVEQVAETAHLVDLCVDYVGRDGIEDMARLAARFATDVTTPVVLDSTEPEVLQAGLEHLGGRSVLNSANLEDGDGEGSRADRVFSLARDHGAAVICLLIDEKGQARTTEWKMDVAHRLYAVATTRYGLDPDALLFDALTFPLSTGDDDLRRDAIATLEAIERIKTDLPGVHTVLGVSNISFGLNPVARKVLNSVFLHEACQRGLDAAIVHAGKLIPFHAIEPGQREMCLDLIYDRRRPDRDPLEELLDAFADASSVTAVAEDSLDGLPIEERLQRRIVDGKKAGLEEDLDLALADGHSALEIINDVLLGGMKTVGDLFASGEMQLPFVLRSAETMKTAVAHLEPHMEKADIADRGSIVLATVQGDVHDIGKNLVDIILTNNGFRVHNLGIKVPVDTLIQTYEETQADAIGMSGLLVKSTLIMRDNLAELSRRGLDHVPVLLGGAALTRRYVEEDLRRQYTGPLFYGKDAFAGLAAMTAIADGGPVEAPPPRNAPRPRVENGSGPAAVSGQTSSVQTDNEVFKPPFVGSRVIKGIPVDEIAPYLNLTALFRNQWQYRPQNGESHPDFVQRMEPLLSEQLNKARVADLFIPQVVYGYFPANGDGDDLIVWEDESRKRELTRFTFPRQSQDPFLCVSDLHRSIESGDLDYAAFHIVSMGPRISERTAELFENDRYSDYLHLHGLGVEMAEALAEYWHHRIRSEWGFVHEDGPSLLGLFRQQYRGGRYSWGYPACPDLEDNATVATLLGAARIGVDVSAETGFQYQPEQTTSAIICHHPEAKYFVVKRKREAQRVD